jgi:hypothetical protein
VDEPGADVALGGHPPGEVQEQQRRRERHEHDERPRAGERPHLLRPPERRQPAQPPGAADRVGDHAQQQRRGRDGQAERHRQPAARRQLAGHRADPGEDERHRRRGQREVGRAADGQAAGDEAQQLGRPDDDDADADGGGRRAERGAPADRGGQDELHPAGVLLGAQRAHAGKHAEHRGGDRQRPADAPRRVAGDADHVVGLAVDEAQALVGRKAVREGDPFAHRRVGVAEADRLDVRVGGEEVGERDRPGAGVAQRPADERRRRAHAARS